MALISRGFSAVESEPHIFSRLLSRKNNKTDVYNHTGIYIMLKKIKIDYYKSKNG